MIFHIKTHSWVKDNINSNLQYWRQKMYDIHSYINTKVLRWKRKKKVLLLCLRESYFTDNNTLKEYNISRGENRTHTRLLSQDFKSCVSTYFTTRPRSFYMKERYSYLLFVCLDFVLFQSYIRLFKVPY
jgi:hypothetical protein